MAIIVVLNPELSARGVPGSFGNDVAADFAGNAGVSELFADFFDFRTVRGEI